MAARLALLILAMLLAGPATAQDLGPWQGRWEGRVESEALGVEAGAAATLEVEPAGEGFALAWSTGGPVAQASLRATGRPGMFAAGEAGIMARLMGDSAPDPLVGDTLIWARLEPGALHLYSLKMEPDGRFAIDRHEWRPEGDAMALRLVRRAAETVEGELRATLRRGSAP
jgi:hypothetical protein